MQTEVYARVQNKYHNRLSELWQLLHSQPPGEPVTKVTVCSQMVPQEVKEYCAFTYSGAYMIAIETVTEQVQAPLFVQR